MSPQELKEYINQLGSITMLTERRKYILEAGILLLLAIFLVNWISPQSNALYFLLVFPALIALGIFIFLVVKIFNRPELGIPIIAVVLPLERIGALNYSSVNLRLSQVFIIITLIAYIIHVAFTDKKNKLLGISIKKDWSFYLLCIFALINIASVAIALNRSRSIFVLSSDLFIFFVYIFISNLLISKDILKKIVLTILITSAIICLFGIFQFIAGMLNLPTSISGLREGYTKAVFGFPRVQATESEPQFWGNFLLIPISLSLVIILSFLTRHKNKLKDTSIDTYLLFISIVTLVLALINLLMTFSRGAWYASIISILIIFLFYIRKLFNIRTLIISAILLVLAGGGFIFILNKVNAPLTLDIFTSRATQIDDSDRTITTNDAMRYFSSHQILGIGAGSFGPYEAPNIYQKPNAYGLDIGWRIVNNEYIEILTETGILGLTAFILFIGYVTISVFFALKAKTDTYTKAILLGLFAAFAGMLVQYYGFSTLYVMQVWVLFAILNAVAFNVNNKIWKYE